MLMRMARVCAARRRSRSGVSRNHRTRGFEARRSPAAAGVHHAHVRNDHARDAARHRAERSTRRCSSSMAPPKPACCSWNASTGCCIRTKTIATSISCRCRARHTWRACWSRRSAARGCRCCATTSATWCASRRIARMRVRPAQRRPAARARGGPARRLHRSERRDDHAADARRRDPRRARAGGHDRAVAIERRQPARRRSRIAQSAATAAQAVAALLARPIRGERVSAIAPEASGKYRLVKR